MKNYISYRAGRGNPREFLFFDDADGRECTEALELAKRGRGAVFLRPLGESWQRVPQIRGAFEAVSFAVTGCEGVIATTGAL